MIEEAVTTNPYTLTGLLEGSPYVVWVRPDEVENLWSDYAVFETTTSFKTPTDLKVIEVSTNTATLSWTENGTATSWDVMYGAFDDDYNVIESSITTVTANENPFVLTGLSPDTYYAFLVRPHCDVESVWSSAISFQTLYESVRPDAIDMGEITSNSATVYWAGDESCDSYTVHTLLARDITRLKTS